jgi:putative inorganic carbon (HCO3(-)) transporter
VKRRTKQLDIDPVRRVSLAAPFPIRSDYESVRPSRQARETHEALTTHPTPVLQTNLLASSASTGAKVKVVSLPTGHVESPSRPTGEKWRLKHGHTLTYVGLFLFTVVLYARPSEFSPSPIAASMALIVALATLGFFIPTQLSLEGTLTARPSEVNFVLLFCLTALLSIPLAMSPPDAWHEFSGTFIRCIVMFIVIVNAVRTEARLKGLLFLALASAVWLSVEAINDFRLGLATVEGYRVGGRGVGIFGNSNDMALHLVTILPIAIVFVFGSRGTVRRILYGACAALMIAGIVLSYSRGAFIGLVAIFVFLAMKMGRRNRIGMALAILLIGIGFMLFAPGNYVGRLLSIFVPSLDPVGSSSARRAELIRSAYVALRHPILGIGMGNYGPQMSYRGLVTHNAYTQVAAEMGLAALACYLMFILTPLRKLGQMARETFEARRNSHFYYLSVGLQAGLIGYLVTSFFLSVAFNWYVYYLVGYAVCLRRLYESETGKAVVVEKRKERKARAREGASRINSQEGAVTT